MNQLTRQQKFQYYVPQYRIQTKILFAYLVKYLRYSVLANYQFQNDIRIDKIASADYV